MSLSGHYNRLLEKLQDSFAELTAKLQSVFKIGPESSIRIRRRQFLMGGCLVLGITVFTYAVMNVLRNQGPVQRQETTPKPTTTNIATATKQVDMNEVRWNNLDASLNTLRNQVAEIAEAVYGGTNKLKDDPSQTDSVQTSEEDSKTEQEHEKTMSSHDPVSNPELEAIKERLAILETRNDDQPQPSTVGQPTSYNPSQNGDEQNASSIQKLSLNLAESSKPLKTPETIIPVGTFAKTVLLSGLDASSAMNASSDPRPMLLRIIDHGTLPRRFQSDLKDCHCTAGAYGDLSSERVYARLEKLSCIDRFTGEIIELQVSGYVSGADGKAGIRGVVASKDGQFLARSLMGGMFAGLSNVANPQNRRAQVNPFFGGGAVGGGAAGSQPSGPSIGETFMSGMAGGATTALDRLSQYYIDRAEQLQPVIQIAAGQMVDIVFTSGAELCSGQYSVSSIQKIEEKGDQ
jgi:conjugal transfer pilus assembly protein TraB